MRNLRKPGNTRRNPAMQGLPGMQGGGKAVDITEALKLKFSGRKFSTRKVRNSVRGYLKKN